MVDVLSGLQLPYCVASNGPLEKLELTLGLTGLKRFFEDRVYSAYTINSWKPAPDLFLHAARELETSPQRCIVVEDSLPGIQAGIAAGMRVIAFRASDLPSEIHACVDSVHDFREIGSIVQSRIV